VRRCSGGTAIDVTCAKVNDGLLMRILVLLLASSFLLGCKPSSTSTSSRPAQQPTITARSTTKIEGCSLITKEEVGAIQNTTVTQAKTSEGSDGNHLITQCYYATTGPNLSVSVAVTQVDPRNPIAVSPRQYWEQTFSRFNKEMDADRKEEEEREQKGRGQEDKEEKMPPPRKVEGVGEEAFWTGNRFGGALYVLKGDVFIRISVGGPDNQETKIEKSKTLAQKALNRL
jgi:hypothetical protein